MGFSEWTKKKREQYREYSDKYEHWKEANRERNIQAIDRRKKSLEGEKEYWSKRADEKRYHESIKKDRDYAQGYDSRPLLGATEKRQRRAGFDSIGPSLFSSGGSAFGSGLTGSGIFGPAPKRRRRVSSRRRR